MNITEEVNFDNRQRGNVEELAHLQSPSEPIATFTFDKEGHIERFPIFRKLFLTLVIILVALLSFGLGRLSIVGKGEPVKIEYDASISNSASAVKALPSVANSQLKIENSESVVASKNGSKYHYLHCPGAKQIREANKITFATPSAAEAAGYTLASNCQSR